jgi:hypothetical protein
VVGVTGHAARASRVLLVALVVWLAGAGEARAQLGALMSPGPLARAHSSLEGLVNCQKCHEPGRRVTAERCLTCHKPIADRIARRTGVHRNVTDDCVSCHIDHAGADGELRPFDTRSFNHAAETGFPLDGKHAGAHVSCTSCHKTRSFLTANPSCQTCHIDTHKGSLGAACARCHSDREAFAAATVHFDHTITAFALTGAHRSVACTACHKNAGYRIARFDSCATCHATPHAPNVSPTCTTCHTSNNWVSKTFNHDRTAFPLAGRHAQTPCASCHKAPATRVKPPSATCAACHADPHKGGFTQDCGSCHTEKGFADAPFDHVKRTGFALDEGHAQLTCAACHKNLTKAPGSKAMRAVDFRGLATTCVTCHADPHTAELGTSCESCHTVRSFAVTSFTHPAERAFFVGPHATATCAACHTPRGAPESGAPHAKLPASFRTTPTACAACHEDVHLGQVGADCQACHSITAARFAPDRFEHAKTDYPLTGRHSSVACARCHARQTTAFPARAGTATRLTGIETTCATCHVDTHLGQLQTACERCHSTDSFTVKRYQHADPSRDFFVGRHESARCAACHKREQGVFPAGRGTAVRFDVSTSCLTCHTDPHGGALGNDCGRCHRPEPASPEFWRIP